MACEERCSSACTVSGVKLETVAVACSRLPGIPKCESCHQRNRVCLSSFEVACAVGAPWPSPFHASVRYAGHATGCWESCCSGGGLSPTGGGLDGGRRGDGRMAGMAGGVVPASSELRDRAEVKSQLWNKPCGHSDAARRERACHLPAFIVGGGVAALSPLRPAAQESDELSSGVSDAGRGCWRMRVHSCG